jgi:hypothetical protein
MSAREQLNSYIRQWERRLRLGASTRGAAIVASAAFVVTLLLVLIANAFAFSGWSITGARLFLLCALVAAAAAGLALPLMRLTRRRAAAKAEAAFPGFQQRLVTFVERDAVHEPFLDLLAADTLDKARGFDPERLVSNRALAASLGVGFVAVAALVWMIAAGPGYLGYGASLLWLGRHAAGAPIYEIRVAPGNASVRRNSDELVTAQPIGFSASEVHLFARYDSATKWNELSMKPRPKGSGFEFTFAGLPEGVEYYAESGAVRSHEFHISVVDLPSVKRIHATYHYPSWTGWKDVADTHGGDLHAVQGTTADLSIQTDRPLRHGVLVLSDGRQIPLSAGKNGSYQVSLPMTKNGAYHVAAIYQGQPVRLTEDYFIEADKPAPPQVQIARPTGDYRASPIEEVTVDVKAADDYGLKGLALHYSVNGGPEKTIDLLKHPGVKQADGSSVLSLEQFKAVPGDVVAYYATAKDARTESHTGIGFIQARPFEIDYSQSQQAGGGGGGRGMNNQAQISEREKELIASTWNQRNAQNPSAQQTADEAKFLSKAQAELQKQAEALAGRMQLRDLNQQNQAFGSFQADMNAAAQAMGPAAQKLGRRQWQQALPDEQKALQHLLQAEATFRQIQVAFGGRGGGAGGGNAGRDLAGLFDLELDTQKNQYETAQTASSSNQNQNSRKVDDALRKLDELARQQQDLMSQQQANNAQSFQQRWQEEILHRDIQQLRQQLQSLEQSLQQQSQQQGSASSSSGQASQGSSSQAGANSNIQRAVNALRQASQALGQAATQSRNSAADARRAADAIREAMNALGALQNNQASGRIGSMAREAQQLQGQQQAQANSLRRLTQANSSAQSYQQMQSLAKQRQQLADGLAQLQQQMRDASRQLAPTQPGAASKLRDALGNLDKADLETQLQREADWLRQGYAPDPGSDSQMGPELQQLANNLRQAQSALGPAQSPNSQTATALNRAEQLRNEMQALQRALGSGNRANGQARSGRQGQQGGQPGQGQMARGGQPGRTGSGPVGGLDIPTPSTGRVGSSVYQGYNGSRGPVGVPYWNIDTGGQKYTTGRAAPPNNSPIPGDPEAVFQQYANTLNQLQRSVQQDPEIAREVRDLVRQMQGLDPRRFPGNPQVFDQMAQQALTGVDKIELQLRNKLSSQGGQIRSAVPMPIPPGYQNAVADYFRRLSQTH